MGNDDSIVKAARISYNNHDVKEDPTKTRHLIRYLMRNYHTTPFEMVEFKFHIKVPIYIARQWLRHRTASVNEISARYTKVNDEYFIPHTMRKQSKTNHQGSDPNDIFDAEMDSELQKLLINSCNTSFDVYERLVSSGVAKEVARSCLPVNSMTEFYWKINLHNLFHFLHLRMSDHAQFEISTVSKSMYEIIKPIVPIACEAFEDYRLNAVILTGPELKALQTKDTSNLSKREKDELIEKWAKITNESNTGSTE